MNRRKAFLAIISIVPFFLLVTTIFLLMLIEFKHGTELPEGYKFLCSLEGGKITLKTPTGRISPNVWRTKYTAASFAWYWKKVEDESFVPESSKYTWDECRR